jgi:pimeloyl-ACP methyl ester carboxylesterase
VRPVYALDLPGYGSSDRSERDYTPRLMTDAVLALAEEIRCAHAGGAIDAIALSLSCEFLARAAVEAPEVFRTLGLVSPTGFSGTKRRDGPPGSTLGMDWLYRALRFPPWDRALFAGLTARPVVRYFLERTWGAREIDERLLEYDVATTRQPGARFAPYCFLAGRLFSNDIRRVYETLRQPVWMTHGVRGDFVDYRQKRDFEQRVNWRIDVLQTGALPHFEALDEFVRRYEAALVDLQA